MIKCAIFKFNLLGTTNNFDEIRSLPPVFETFILLQKMKNTISNQMVYFRYMPMFLVEPKLNYETDNKKSLEWAIFVLQRKKIMKELDIERAQEIIGEYINKLMSDK